MAFWLADEDTRTLRIQSLRDTSSGTGENIEELRFGEGAVGWVAVERQPLAIVDIHADGRFVARDWARSRGFRSLYAAPLLDQGRLLGVLVLIGEQPFRFSPDDEDLLQSFSAQAAAAIRNARLYEETRRYADRLRALEEVNRLVSSSLNVEEVLQNLARAIAQFFDAPFVSIWAFDAGAQRLRRALTFGDPELAAELHDDLALGEGAVGWVVQHREPIMWTEAATDPRFVDVPSLSARGLRWMTVYPIAIGDRMLGAFAVHRAATWPITPETSSLMGSLAAQAAIALENARLYSETSRRLDRDARAARGGRDPQLHPGLAHAAQAGDAQGGAGVPRRPLHARAVGRRSVVPLMSQFADGRRMPRMWQEFRDGPGTPPAAIPANAQVIETRQPLVIDDCATSPLLPREWVEAYGLRSVPDRAAAAPGGCHRRDDARLLPSRPARFQDWQQDLAQAIAGQLALALENTRLYARRRSA